MLPYPKSGLAHLPVARGRPAPDTEEQRAWVVALAERGADRERSLG